MNTYQEEPDGFILYDERPDPFDNRRASRTRFAAVNLPILLGISAVSALLLWITQSCLGQCGINRQVGGAVHVFAIALYGLLHYQSTWLEKRCNDAGKGHYPAIWMFRISLVLAAISLILPVFTLPMVAGGFLGFDDEIGQAGNLRLFVRQQARRIGRTQRGGNQVKNRGHDGFPIRKVV